MKPDTTPIGLQLAVTSKAVGRAFNASLAEAGGSLPIWLVLSMLKGESRRTQHELARAVGIEGPTLTRHLDGLEAAGLVVRRRHPVDRRAIQVELTARGEALHATPRSSSCERRSAGSRRTSYPTVPTGLSWIQADEV